jgi:hypothetical protein
MPHARDVLATAVLCLLVSIANAQGFAPGQLFPGALLNVRAPNSDGWKLQQTSATGMTFFRTGASASETYVAQVSLFAYPGSRNRDEFVAFVKAGFEKYTPPERFKSLESNYEYTEERGYPCVRVTAVVQDTKAFFGRESLTLQWHSFYCLHPKRQDAGFVISFSHRGAPLDADLDVKAQAFIEGVQVPEK